MAHFALVVDNVVQQVIVAEQDFIDRTMAPMHPEGQWIQTSYNTHGGVHYDPNTGEPSADQTKAMRYNFAGVGSIYYPDADAFSDPAPFPSWVLNTDTYTWQAPVPYPGVMGQDPVYTWNEATQSWEEFVLPS